MPLRLNEIQGNISPGFRKDHQAFVFVRFGDGPGPREWLGELQHVVASAEELQAFDVLFKLVGQRRAARETEVVRSTWINVALSWTGLQRIGAPRCEEFPDEFRD